MSSDAYNHFNYTLAHELGSPSLQETFSSWEAEHKDLATLHTTFNKHSSHSPVPELIFAKERPRFVSVYFQEYLNYIQSKEDPLCIRNIGGFLIQSNEDSID